MVTTSIIVAVTQVGIRIVVNINRINRIDDTTTEAQGGIGQTDLVFSVVMIVSACRCCCRPLCRRPPHMM